MIVFGFKATNSELVVSNLSGSYTKVILDSTAISISKFIKKLDTSSHDMILGLGQYGGRDNTGLRLEQLAKNKFRNERIGKIPIIQLNSFLQPLPTMALGNGMGNSWCNLISYLIATKHPNIRYSFIHVPKHYPLEMVSRDLQTLLSS